MYTNNIDDDEEIVDDKFSEFSRFSTKFDLIDQIELEEAQEEQFNNRIYSRQFDVDLLEGRAFA